MGSISSGMGLVSGINHKEIIDQLIALESRPKILLLNRISKADGKKLAYTDISTRLTTLKLVATTLKKTNTFEAASATSSNSDVMTATAATGAAVGSYQFQVARLVASQQSVTRGFADTQSTVGAGTITIEMGGGEISSQTTLSQLNGGTGVRRGLFRITDRSGKSAVIDVTNSVTLDDVVKKINTSLDISMKASLNGDKLVLTDQSGSTAQGIVVQDLAGGYAATDLGLIGAGVVNAGNTLTGTDINYVGDATALSQLNDGRGVRTADSGADFRIALSDGTTHDITLGTTKTISELKTLVETATGGDATIEIDAGGNGIKLSDNTGGGGTFQVTALNSSLAANDLGILGTGAGGVINGSPVIAGLNTVLLSSLDGGGGLSLGTLSITDRAGASANIDLSGAKTVQDVLDLISNNGSVNVTAALNAAGNGIALTDDTGSTGNLVVTDDATSQALGLNGTFGTSVTTVQGKNLQRQWVSENTLLETFNGGKGITRGIFKITNSAGISADVDLTQGNETTLADVIAEINAKAIGVTASINAQGDGLLLTDTAGGALKMKVEDQSGTAAKDLNIAGEAAATTLDGSYEKTITVAGTDTLDGVQKAINELGWGVTASIINDGTAGQPYRLSLSSRNAGRAGRVVFDAGATLLQTSNLVEAQDAAVFLGSSDTAQPILITSGKNQVANVIKGVTLDLHGVSKDPVTINISRDSENVSGQLSKFVESFNAMIDKIKELTKFDEKTFQRGPLLGDSAIEKVRTQVYTAVTTVVSTAGKYRIMADVGVKSAEGAKLEFDEEKFNQAFAEDPESVKKLFSQLETGLGEVLEKKIERLIDPVTGVITLENKAIDATTDDMKKRIEQLDKQLEAKRLRLERQFVQMEQVLANLQSQQSALLQYQPVKPMTSTQRN